MLGRAVVFFGVHSNPFIAEHGLFLREGNSKVLGLFVFFPSSTDATDARNEKVA